MCFFKEVDVVRNVQHVTALPVCLHLRMPSNVIWGYSNVCSLGLDLCLTCPLQHSLQSGLAFPMARTVDDFKACRRRCAIK